MDEIKVLSLSDDIVSVGIPKGVLWDDDLLGGGLYPFVSSVASCSATHVDVFGLGGSLRRFERAILREFIRSESFRDFAPNCVSLSLVDLVEDENDLEWFAKSVPSHVSSVTVESWRITEPCFPL